MPELRGKQFPDFVPVDIDTDTIPFKDKIREKQRQKLLEQKRKERTENEGRRKFIKNKAWSKQKAKKERKKKMNAKRKKDEVMCSLFSKLRLLTLHWEEQQGRLCLHRRFMASPSYVGTLSLPHSILGPVVWAALLADPRACRP